MPFASSCVIVHTLRSIYILVIFSNRIDGK
jgi:hypothetical protein